MRIATGLVMVLAAGCPVDPEAPQERLCEVPCDGCGQPGEGIRLDRRVEALVDAGTCGMSITRCHGQDYGWFSSDASSTVIFLRVPGAQGDDVAEVFVPQGDGGSDGRLQFIARNYSKSFDAPWQDSPSGCPLGDRSGVEDASLLDSAWFIRVVDTSTTPAETTVRAWQKGTLGTCAIRATYPVGPACAD